jgi:hypothetical protein
VETTTCRACRSVNHAGVPRCVNCGADLAVVESFASQIATDDPTSSAPTSPTPDLPPGAPLPPAPISADGRTPHQVEPPRRGLSGAGIAAIGIGLVAAVVAVVMIASRGSDGLPDRVAGLQRLDSSEARAFEEMIGSIEIMDVRIDAAMYGIDGRPQLLLEVFRDPPGGNRIPVDTFFTGSIGGFEGTSGMAVDRQSMVSRSVGSADVACARIDMGGAPSQIGLPGSGVLCAWTGPTAGILIDLRGAGSVDAAIGAVAGLQPELA